MALPWIRLHLGIANPAGDSERAYISAAMERGWPPEQLAELGGFRQGLDELSTMPGGEGHLWAVFASLRDAVARAGHGEYEADAKLGPP
jgi:hypothetical protein